MQHDGSDAARGPDAPAISLAGRRAARMHFTSLSTLRAYWEALRAGRDMPARSEIDPRGIEAALGEAFIAERIAPGVLRLRIAGMTLNDFMGMEVRGMPLTALVDPEARERFASTCERVLAEPAIAEFALHSPASFGRPGIDGQMLLLPLRGADGSVNRVLGGFAISGRIGRTPRRVAPMRLQLQPLEIDGQAPSDPGEATPKQPGFAETPATFAPAPKRRAPHLRLVKSD